MKLIVQKYGGSSVSDVDKLKKIASMIAAVRKQQIDVVVVVSAMGKTTNQLIEMAKAISPDPPRREMDMLLSTGERTSMALLCIALHEEGIESISLTGSQAGIITNDRHNDARVIEVRPIRVLDEIDKGKVVVIGGFQGVSYKRDITTLGRGGSDTSAVALAAALNAERCEIYSDVDGVYTTDPNIVANAKHLPEISYQQIQEMAEAGAKVLNAQAVQFAKEAKITLFARDTFKPGKETIIKDVSRKELSSVLAVVYEKDIVRVFVHDADKIYVVLDFLEKNQIPIKEFQVSGISGDKGYKCSFIISTSSLYNWEKVKESLEEKLRDGIYINENFAAISIIGEGFSRNNDALIETMKLLDSKAINYYGINTTSFRISLLVEKNLLNEAVKICHEYWIK
ncbi:MAG: aspartate kinase [Ignavibacteriota bacterium]|jgi:aspartate kinase|nr:MAG: aspartate kinase [Chlorobiota bacterium]MBE7478040.1 aspartate kinase [Ignavibacteriales bacterium]MBL1123428.1 aspartate kinase [Ignavibacteriota bacterium]MCC7094538.1 aspartate kinase [Ignavibacteriaceae bacterium]MCE7856627.1 aspartate kinase [Ignavibacteria bacterium CHB3]MEB2297316.1 aspartate kinase [Ignavibacteria bacterium]